MRTLIKNGRIATAGDLFYGDIAIEDGIIRSIGSNITENYDNVINASGKLVIPGGIDVHTHFNLHTASAVARDDFYIGSIAAACGGTTCVVDHMGFGPDGCSLDHQLKLYHQFAKGNAVIDYSFHGVLQHISEDVLYQLDAMVINEGISSFKAYMTYDYRIEDSGLLKVMEKLKSLHGMLTVHGENHEIISFLTKKFKAEGLASPIYHALSRPDYCEGDAVKRLVSLAAAVKDMNLYIVHLSTEDALQHVMNAIASGVRIYAETCPQYLLLDDERYQHKEEGLKYILSPPLRNRKNCDALWQGINSGYIQVVATDHCPFSFELDKKKGRDDFSKCPNGLPGVEERIPLMFSEGVMKGRISINKLVEVCCTNPAKLFGMYPRKGTLLPGSDGDIVIIDPEMEVQLTHGMLHSNVDYTAYEGFKLVGYPVMTLSRGEIIVQNNEFIGAKGRGRFIKRNGLIT